MAEQQTDMVFDSNTMLERMGGDTELLGEVIELFMEDSPRMLSSVRDAVSSENAGEVERAAHSLKGALLNMAADAAAAIALQLEKMGREKELVDTASVVADLEREMGRLQAELDSFEI